MIRAVGNGCSGLANLRGVSPDLEPSNRRSHRIPPDQFAAIVQLYRSGGETPVHRPKLDRVVSHPLLNRIGEELPIAISLNPLKSGTAPPRLLFRGTREYCRRSGAEGGLTPECACSRQPRCTGSGQALSYHVSICMRSPGISFAYRVRRFRPARWPRQRLGVGRGKHSIDCSSRYLKIVGTPEFALDPPRTESPAAEFENPCTLTFSDVSGWRPLRPSALVRQTSFPTLILPYPFTKRRSRHATLRPSDAVVFVLIEELDPPETFPDFHIHPAINSKQCPLATQINICLGVPEACLLVAAWVEPATAGT